MNRIICLLIIALEGSSLLSYEIIASRLYTPYLGSSIHVWTSILTMTLIALALGYYYGARITKIKITKYLRIALLAGSIFIFISPLTSAFILPATYDLSLELASLISGITPRACVILFLPPKVAAVSPEALLSEAEFCAPTAGAVLESHRAMADP